MFRVFQRLLILFPLVLATITSTLADEKNTYWVLHEKEFLCLKNNVDVYLGANSNHSPSDRVLIFIAECPETDIAKLFADRTQNSSSLPSVDLDGQGKTQPAQIISMLPNQLQCLKSLDLEVVDKLVQLPKEPCL